MRKFKPRFGKEVNLDNPDTYKNLPKTDKECDDEMLKRIGYAILYMDYIRKQSFPNDKEKVTKIKMKSKNFCCRKKADRWYNCGYYQRMRVMKLIKHFGNHRQKKWGNHKWFQEQLFLFDSETENMC